MGLYGVTEIQLTCVLLCFISGFNRAIYSLTLGDIFGKDTYMMTEWTTPDGSRPLGQALLTSTVIITLPLLAFPGLLLQICSAYMHTENKPKWKAILGFFPMIEYWATVYCTFFCSTWGAENSGLAFLLLMPAHVLMTSRQITCNFTRD